jgi:ketosteroid isomerase-like protein
MNLQLAESISTYFAASNGTDTVRITDSFTPDAVVFDEGSIHQGHAAIQAWLQEARTKSEYRVEPTSTSVEEDRVTVVAKVSGNFPGSPIQLRHSFQLEGGKIQSLEIQ